MGCKRRRLTRKTKSRRKLIKGWIHKMIQARSRARLSQNSHNTEAENFETSMPGPSNEEKQLLVSLSQNYERNSDCDITEIIYNSTSTLETSETFEIINNETITSIMDTFVINQEPQGPRSWTVHNCGLCSYKTASNYSIMKHIAHHYASSDNNNLFDCATSTPETYKCDTCNLTTNIARIFNEHDHPTLKKIKNVSIKNVGGFTCENCDFETFSRLIFMKHVNEQCPITTLNETSSKHLSQTGESQYQFLKRCAANNISCLKCDHCFFQIKMKGNLKSHTVQHQKNKPKYDKWIECKQCLYNIKQLFSLKLHILTEHTSLEEIQWFCCDKCLYKSKFKDQLDSHVLAIHEIQYIHCDQCSFKTTRMRYLQKHIKKKHKNQLI